MLNLTTLRFSLFTLLMCCFSSVFSQREEEVLLVPLFEQFRQEIDDSTRLVLNEEIEKLFTLALQKENAFDYSFSQIKSIGSVYSDNHLVRIISWNYMLNDKQYAYSSFILKKKNKKDTFPKVYPISCLKAIKPHINKVYYANNWYGSLYYKIIHQKGKYLLLGYSNYQDITKLKVIDVLQFKGKRISFGSRMFKITRRSQQRLVFEYSPKAMMNISYETKKKRFVFDHLMPHDLAFDKMYQFYGPDFTYDALIYKKKMWRLIQDIDIIYTQ